MSRYSTILFDLDGTLLDTLTDLSASVNHALRMHELPERTRNEVRAFLGNGIRNLMKNAVTEDISDELFETVFRAFRAHYMAHSLDATAPYPDIISTLDELRNRGVRMGIISNKLHAAVKDLNARFFAQYMGVAVGESPEVRRKPYPDAVIEAMRKLSASPEATLYVGDSEVDFATARAAGVDCALVLWGFRDEKELRLLQAEYYVSVPTELLTLL